jgi:hypothetical protein
LINGYPPAAQSPPPTKATSTCPRRQLLPPRARHRKPGIYTLEWAGPWRKNIDGSIAKVQGEVDVAATPKIGSIVTVKGSAIPDHEAVRRRHIRR